jgi:hypothetical protein
MKKKNARQVVVATRASKRIPRDGVPIAEKATSRAITKNTILGTKNTILGTKKTSNSFTVLSDTPSLTLQNVLSDLNVMVDNVEDQIRVFKAEELARAALVEANYKIFLEKQKDRYKPLSDDPSDGLSLETIDNSMRLDLKNSTIEGG